MLGHAGLGTALLVLDRAPAEIRRRALELAGASGALLGLGLVVAGRAGGGWRTTSFEPAEASPAGLAIACAWILYVALESERARVLPGALVGVAASGLALAATGRFVVPALLFWLCSSLAVAGIAGFDEDRAGRGWIWLCLALSDAGVCAAAIGHVQGADAWTFTGIEDGWAFWALVGAALVRGVVLLVLGGWSTLGTRAAPAVPLMVGGAVLLAGRAGRTEPWLALALLATGLASAGLVLAGKKLRSRFLSGWPVALALAVTFVTPAHKPLAGSAAIVVVSVMTLWPFAAGRGGFGRGLLLSLVPLTAGFGVVTAGATVSFERAIEEVTVLGSAPWTLIAALLPLALAAGVVLGGRIARAQSGDFVPEAVLATWVLVALGVAIGLTPSVLGGSDAGIGDSGGVFALHCLALAGGFGAAAATRRWDLGSSFGPEQVVVDAGQAAVGWRSLSWGAAATAVATAGGAAWLTVRGLSVGFL